MTIIYNGLSITISTPDMLTLIALVKYGIDGHYKKKNAIKTHSREA